MAPKPMWLYRQSGVIPWRRDKDGIEILLITSIRRGRWIVPKGVVERHLSPGESARKEAWEEAGVTGTLSREVVGTYEYEKWGGTCTVSMYLLKVESEEEDWPERKERKRKWVSLEKAIKLVEDENLGDVIRAAGEQLEK